MGIGAPELPPEFSEISSLTQKRASHRADMQSLVDAAEYLGTKYQAMYCKRVEQLLNYLEETNDVATFRQKLVEMMKEPPADEVVETVRNASFFGRLMGLVSGENSRSDSGFTTSWHYFSLQAQCLCLCAIKELTRIIGFSEY